MFSNGYSNLYFDIGFRPENVRSLFFYGLKNLFINTFVLMEMLLGSNI
jgi:hypothetical protein